MKQSKKFFNRFLFSAATGLTVLAAGAQTPQLPDFSESIESARNDLIRVMTKVDPLTQPTTTTPPYGVTGWMPIAADSLLRFAGTKYPNAFNNDGATYTKDASNSYIKQTEVRCSSTYSHVHQPFAITVQQRRDYGRRIEPVVIYFVASQSKGYNQLTQSGSSYDVAGHIYVQSMIDVPECTNIGHYDDAEWINIYSDWVLIHQTRPQDDMIHGNYSNNIKRNEAFDAITSASACDLDGDGYDEILVFYSNRMAVFDGKTFEYRKCVDLSGIDANFAGYYYSNNLSYGYETTHQGAIPNTWTSVASDIDGDGIEDVLAVCHSGFYWDHLTAKEPSKDSEVSSQTGTVRCVFIPGGKGIDKTPVVNSMGATPVLMWDAKDADVFRYKRFPRWNDTSYNNHDGVFNHDMYHYYHVTLTADVIYPNGMCNSDQPVLAIAWKYLWSDCPTESGDISYSDKDFRTGLHEWYQLTTYNLTYNKTAITEQSQGTPVCNSKVDIFQLLDKAGEWHESSLVDGAVITPLYYSAGYNKVVNARASLRRPAFKTWYAGGRTMPPFLFFEGMNLYFNPGISGDLAKYTIAETDALGYESGWPKNPLVSIPSGRICGPIYTYYNHIDEDGALDDRESIMVPVATRKVTADDSDRYQDNEYCLVNGRFNKYNPSDLSQALVTSSSSSAGTGPTGQNAIFYYVPFTANTAKVELLDSYFTASNPIVKAVLAMPPYNDDDVESHETAQVAFARSAEQGQEKGNTTSTTLGGGFSMEFTLFSAFKMGYSYSYEHSWDKTWAQSYEMASETEYASPLTNPANLVVFNYIPVDCFVYNVTQSPRNPALEGKTFTFRRALNMLNGEAHMPEVCWTVDDYNQWVAGTGVPRIDKNILPHKIGDINSYRRVPKFSGKEAIISQFPRKTDGFYAVHDCGTAGSSDIKHTLSISNGNSMSVGESFSHSHEISFGFEKDGVIFAGSVNSKFGVSEAWEATTSWTTSMSVSGTIPAVKDVSQNAYDFYQVWYEYADTVTGQDFLVCDWAVGQNNTSPVYVNLELACLYDLDDDVEKESYYVPQLNWSVMSNSPVSHCVLEYKLDGLTPIRDNEDIHAYVTLDKNLTDWAPVEKKFDETRSEWVDNEFLNKDSINFVSWEHYDFFTLTNDQQDIIKAAVKDGSDIYVHYRVKVYQAAPAAVRSRAGAPEGYELVATSNEVSAKLLSGGVTSAGSIVDDSDPDAPVEIYTLQGCRVHETANLAPGIYIRRQGTSTTKIYVK